MAAIALSKAQVIRKIRTQMKIMVGSFPRLLSYAIKNTANPTSARQAEVLTILPYTGIKKATVTNSF